MANATSCASVWRSASGSRLHSSKIACKASSFFTVLNQFQLFQLHPVGANGGTSPDDFTKHRIIGSCRGREAARVRDAQRTGFETDPIHGKALVNFPLALGWLDLSPALQWALYGNPFSIRVSPQRRRAFLPQSYRVTSKRRVAACSRWQ